MQEKNNVFYKSYKLCIEKINTANSQFVLVEDFCSYDKQYNIVLHKLVNTRTGEEISTEYFCNYLVVQIHKLYCNFTSEEFGHILTYDAELHDLLGFRFLDEMYEKKLSERDLNALSKLSLILKKANMKTTDEQVEKYSANKKVLLNLVDKFNERCFNKFSYDESKFIDCFNNEIV